MQLTFVVAKSDKPKEAETRRSISKQLNTAVVMLIRTNLNFVKEVQKELSPRDFKGIFHKLDPETR